MPEDTVTGTAVASTEVWTRLGGLGITEASVSTTLEQEGVAKFMESWQQLIATVASAAREA